MRELEEYLKEKYFKNGYNIVDDEKCANILIIVKIIFIQKCR